MKPAHPIGLQIVKNIFAKQRILLELGTELVRTEQGLVELRMPRSELALQQHGFFHGGVITTSADTAAGLAAHSVLAKADHSAITVELKINFLRPADGQDLVSIGNIVKENKSLIVTTADVYSGGKLCAFMLQTVKRIIPEGNPSIKVV